MSFVILFFRAYRINRIFNTYKVIKENAIRKKNVLPPDKSHHFWSRCCHIICSNLGQLFTLAPDNLFRQFFVKICTDGTFENYVAKSIVGFLGGMFLTYIFFIVFTVRLNFSVTAATLCSSLLGIILTLGLAFSQITRVVVFLLLPQFFSKNGRQAIIAYAFILVLTGPAKNTLRNTEILSESVACEQEQLKMAVQQFTEAIKKPFMAIRDAFQTAMNTINTIAQKIKAMLTAIKQATFSTLRVIKVVHQWLGNVINICNKKMGTPHQRCIRVFDGAVVDCQAKLGPLFNWLCSVTYLVSKVCYVVKIFDYICTFLEFVSDSVVGVVEKRMKSFAAHMHNILYVSVEFSHSHHFETNQSVSMKEIAASMVTEIHDRTDEFLAIYDWICFAFSFFFLTMLFKAIHYRFKFLTSDEFGNRFITAYFQDIDLNRAGKNLETVLPLNNREERQYIMVKSPQLVASEKNKFLKSALFLGIASLKFFIHMLTDYCLYWVLTTIQRHGRLQITVEAPQTVGLHVEGEGVLADLYRSVANAFQPLGVKMAVDNAACLPNPIPPDFGCYLQIVFLIIICFLLAYLEPYCLRLQHTVLCYYYPDRARQRSAWLYNHILTMRGSFLKFARTQLRRKFGKGKEDVTQEASIVDRLQRRLPFLKIIFGKRQIMCILCGQAVGQGEVQQVTRCPTPNCAGRYCLCCYVELKKICPICAKPTEYGDLSDESLERDSSTDEDHSPPACLRNRKPKNSLTKRISHRRVSEDIELGLMTEDKAENGNRSRSSSELSYSYQYDTNTAGPSAGDPDAQATYKPSTQLRKHSFRKTVSKTTETHENSPNVVTVHVVSKERNVRQRKKRQHPQSYSKRKFKSCVTEEKGVPSDKTGNPECIKYISGSESTSEESDSDDVSTSESSEKWPSLVLTSPQDGNEISRSRTLKRTSSAASKTSNRSTVGRISLQNISQTHSDSSRTDSHSSSTGVSSHEESSKSTEFYTPPSSFKEGDCTGKTHVLDLEGRILKVSDDTAPNVYTVLQYHQHSRDNTHGTEIISDGDNAFQHHSQQAHIPQQQLSYHTDSLENDEHEAYLTPASGSDDECQKGDAEFLQI